MQDKWFKCSHCRAMFRADNNLCISCGSPAELWEGNDPVLSSYEFYTGTSAYAMQHSWTLSTAPVTVVSRILAGVEHGLQS